MINGLVILVIIILFEYIYWTIKGFIKTYKEIKKDKE
jgi:hypothetical protein